MNNFYASVEISNNILNQLVIKYFKLMKNEKEKNPSRNLMRRIFFERIFNF